jgi:hypothetical protein
MTRMSTRTIATLLAASLLLGAACESGPDPAATTGRDQQPAIDIPPPGQTFEIPSRVASIPAIRCKVIAQGSGLTARDGDTVAVHYTGMLEDGTRFDSSRGNVPYEFPLGQGAVIRGWDMIVARMRVGDRWMATVPPQLAYDEAGSPPVIPPNATLTFDMELVRVR